jgi:hypothetical protein
MPLRHYRNWIIVMKRSVEFSNFVWCAACWLLAATSTVAAQGVAPLPVKLPSAYPAEFTAGKVELREPDGKEILSFKPRPPASLTVRDAQNVEVGRFALSDGRLKATGADGKPRFELKRKDDKVMLKDADGEKELFKFKLKGQDIDFYGPNDKLLYRLRHKDYGFALEDASDRTLFRAKVKDDKRVLRDPADKTVLYSKDLSQPLGLVFFRIPQLDSLQQAACCVFFQQKL